MALAKLRLDLADATGPGKVGEILVRPLSASNNSAYWQATSAGRVPLQYNDPTRASSDPAYAPEYTILGEGKWDALVQGAQYEFTVVRINSTIVNQTFTAAIPASASVNFSALTPLVPVPAPPDYTYTQAQIDTKLGNITYASLTGKPSTFAPTIGTTSTTALAGNTSLAPVVPWTSGTWNETTFHGSTFTTTTPTLNMIYYDLIHIPNAITLSAIGCRVGGTAASMVVGLGLYARNSDGTPGTRLVGATVATPAPGAYQVSAGSLSVAAGLYLTALQVTVAAATMLVASGGASNPGRGHTDLLPSATVGPPTGYVQTGLTALPATAAATVATDTQQTRPRTVLLVA